MVATRMGQEVLRYRLLPGTGFPENWDFVIDWLSLLRLVLSSTFVSITGTKVAPSVLAAPCHFRCLGKWLFSGFSLVTLEARADQLAGALFRQHFSVPRDSLRLRGSIIRCLSCPGCSFRFAGAWSVLSVILLDTWNRYPWPLSGIRGRLPPLLALLVLQRQYRSSFALARDK